MNHNEKTSTKRTKTNSHGPQKKKITIKTTHSTTTPQEILPKPVQHDFFQQNVLSQQRQISQQQQQQVSQQDVYSQQQLSQQQQQQIPQQNVLQQQHTLSQQHAALSQQNATLPQQHAALPQHAALSQQYDPQLYSLSLTLPQQQNSDLNQFNQIEIKQVSIYFKIFSYSIMIFIKKLFI